MISPLFSALKAILDLPRARGECHLCFLAGVLPRESALGDGAASHGLFPAHLH